MSGKLNKQEQVEVVIRLKPPSQLYQHPKCVYVSEEQDKTLVVETPSKKEFFVFDNIADEYCDQVEIYEQIGKQVVNSSTQGFNCCIFAYGQTGAGKTYSILGKPHHLAADVHCESRGILPRMLKDLFEWSEGETNRVIVKCSYMEIYNEQIFDLLNYEEKNHQIREDLKRGIFVEGLVEQDVGNYEEAMNVLLKGIKNRKISQTSMNNQSSRSHTIFTLNIESQIPEEETTKWRKSKINIVDLAGSERAKQTKVQGDRLKEGCNINKSLHVLGNVINALVQSSKKKKHIPFRDSRLTHILKDSLCGNSITKLLANIHSSKQYLGETLSTLMFAKRAKILKMKVEINEKVGENFQQLRKQIKKLREQLAEARYIRHEEKLTQKNQTEFNDESEPWEKIVDVSGFDMSKNQSILKTFQQNQLNYKALIDIYEEHMKLCSQTSQVRKSVSVHREWKSLEKKNEAMKNLMKNFPAFTKIFKENILLRKELNQEEKSKLTLNKVIHESSIQQKQFPENTDNSISKEKFGEVIENYEKLLKQVEKSFTSYISKLQGAHQELESEVKAKDEKIKDLLKRKELPPNLEQLQNENEYLKLNVMELEDEVSELQEKMRKYQIQVKQLRREKTNERQLLTFSGVLVQDDCEHYVQKLTQIKNQLEQQIQAHQEQKEEMQSWVEKVKKEIKKIYQENKATKEETETLKIHNRQLRKKVNELLRMEEAQIAKENTNTFWTNEESTQQFMHLELLCERNDEKSRLLMMIEKGDIFREKLEKQLEEEQAKTRELSNQVIKLHKSYGQEIINLKEENQSSEKRRKQLTEENYQLMNKIHHLEELTQQKEKILSHTKSFKNLIKFKEGQSGMTPKATEKVKKEKIDDLRRKLTGEGGKNSLRIKETDDYHRKKHDI